MHTAIPQQSWISSVQFLICMQICHLRYTVFTLNFQFMHTLKNIWVPHQKIHMPYFKTSFYMLHPDCQRGVSIYNTFSILCLFIFKHLNTFFCLISGFHHAFLKSISTRHTHHRSKKSCCQTPTTHTKTSQVISVKHVQHSMWMDHKGSETCQSF